MPSIIILQSATRKYHEMDENYKTFKNEMYFDTSQLELFFNRITNIFGI